MDSDLRPALAGSALLHLLLLAATVIAWPQLSKSVPTATVAVKLVASAPTPDVRPAVQAPTPVPAATPEPAPTPTPPAQAAPPPPVPVPAAPAPAAPTPPPLDLDALATKLPKSQLDLTKLASKLPTKPQPKLDLGALAATLPKAGKAPKGPARPEEAVQARPAVGAGQGLSADEASLLAAKLNRLWNPNCGAEGAANLQVKVEIRLTHPPARSPRRRPWWAASPAIRSGRPRPSGP